MGAGRPVPAYVVLVAGSQLILSVTPVQVARHTLQPDLAGRARTGGRLFFSGSQQLRRNRHLYAKFAKTR